MTRIIYYYQTFTSLKPLLLKNTVVTHIHLSSIHFGKNPDNTPYIHLNDHPPNDKIFNNMWNDIKNANNLGIKIILMVGGAGGAFQTLFSDFETYYDLLKKTINDNKCINGIDLDIEEPVSIDYIKKLMNRIKADFGKDFIITMAPVAYALQSDTTGMGGFCYKDLYKSKEGLLIDYFNVQFYYDFSVESYNKVIDNGYPENKIVLGATSDMDVTNMQNIVKQLYSKYGMNFGGVFDWEYFNAGNDKKNPYKWALDMKNSMLDYNNYCKIL